jgi:iron(III) transport system permease protein
VSRHVVQGTNEVVAARSSAGGTARGPARRAPRFARALRSPKYWILAAVTIVVAYLSLVPLVFLLIETFTDEAGTLANFETVVRDPSFGTLMTASVVFTIGCTAVAMVLGTVMAFLYARTDIAFKPLLFAVALVPLIVPGLLFAVSWVHLASPTNGLLNLALDGMFGVKPLNIYSMWGMVWVEGTNLSTVVFLLMLAGFRSTDPSLEEAASVSGARSWASLRLVMLPLLRPAFLAATLLTAVRAIESFEVPALLGVRANIWVFTSRIWREAQRFPVNMGRLGAYASVLLVLAAVGVLLHNWYAAKGGRERLQTVGGKGFRARSRPIRGNARRAAYAFVVAYILAVVGLPAFALLYSSLVPSNVPPSMAAVESMNLDNYRFVINHPSVGRGLRNSAILAFASASGVMVLMSIAAWVVVRTKVRGRSVLDNLAFMPIAFPSLVLGVAILVVYLRVPLPIYGTLLILLVAYLTKYMPYGMRFASTSMYQVHREMEESAQVCGATWWQGFRRVMLPLIAPGFIAGWLYIAMLSVRELGTSVLIYSPGDEVLAISMFRMYFEGQLNEVSAFGVMLMAGLVVLAVGAQRFSRRFGVREQSSVV